MMRLLYDDTMLPWLCLDTLLRFVFYFPSIYYDYFISGYQISLSLSPAWMIHAFVRPSVRDTYFSYFVFFSCSIMRMYYICLILVFCSVLFCSLSSVFFCFVPLIVFSSVPLSCFYIAGVVSVCPFVFVVAVVVSVVLVVVSAATFVVSCISVAVVIVVTFFGDVAAAACCLSFFFQ